LFDFGAFARFIHKELVQQHKLVLGEKNTLILVEVINEWNLLSRPITHETKALQVIIQAMHYQSFFHCHNFVLNKPHHHWVILVHST
jgi:hypothetical protein